MHRELIELLARYLAAWPDETAIAARFAAFAREHDDCLLRSCRTGHVTASAWIVSADGERFLLTHHRKLGRWLQLGGHVDGEPRVELGALREAQEESGMRQFAFVLPDGSAIAAEDDAAVALHVVPLDLDVHPIPAHGDEPRHDHWDVRFLLRALPGQDLVVSTESRALRWFPAAELPAVTSEESVLRLLRKAQVWSGSRSG